jgi:hypothetical protein
LQTVLVFAIASAKTLEKFVRKRNQFGHLWIVLLVVRYGQKFQNHFVDAHIPKQLLVHQVVA